MKKNVLFLFLMLTLTACSMSDKNDTLIDNSVQSAFTEIPIEFEVVRTTLSKGFQSVTPNVEINDKETEPTFLVNLGVVECTKVKIDKITKVDNNINIYTSSTAEYENTDIVIPQLVIKINNVSRESLKDIKFNIVNSNYETIDLKFDKNHVLDNIYAQFKITSNTIPEVNVIKENGKYIWNVNIHNVFSKQSPDSPLVYFNAKVDSANGEVIDSKWITVSNTIDEGKIISLSSRFLVYVQNISKDDESYQHLWLYDTENNEKTNIFSTHNNIFTAKVSPDSNKIAIIENKEKYTDIFIVDLEKNETKKITPLDLMHTWMIEWYGNKLYAVSNAENRKATLMSFDIEKNQHEILFTLDKNVSEFDVYENNFAFTEFNLDNNSTNIITTSNGIELNTIENSFSPVFLDSDNLMYFKNVVDQDKRTLWIYNKNNDSLKSLTNMDIRNFEIIDDETLLLVGRENYSTEFNLYTYNFNNDNQQSIAKVITETVYYDKINNTIYFNAIPQTNSLNREMIYSVNLNSIPKN